MAAAAWPEATRLARAFARRNQLCHLTEELVGAVGEAVCRAAISFDPAVGVVWRAWWKSKVWYALHDAVRAANPMGYRRVARPGGRDEHAPVTYYVSEPRPDGWSAPELSDKSSLPVGWEAEYEDEVRMLARELPSCHGEFLSRMFLDCRVGVSRCHAAVAMGYRGYSRGGQLYREAMAMVHRLATRRDVFGDRRRADGDGQDVT